MPEFRIAKTDDAQRLIFGWASVALKADGSPLVDLQDDIIEPAELEAAAYDFMLNAGAMDEMHDGRVKGHIVESFYISPEKRQAMGIPEGGTAPQAALWIGAKLSPASYAKVKDGTFKMLSIEGGATPVDA